MDKFCLIINRDKDKKLEVTNKVVKYIEDNNRECIPLECNEGVCSGLYTDITAVPKDTDCIIVLGGDGTILQASHDLISIDVPILGINIGTLGFLADIELHNVYEALDSLFIDDYVLEHRMMLEGCIKRSNEKPYISNALNEVVIERSGFSRIISLSVYVNGQFANRYRGDGILISTPTGSTGYNLSAGGPVVKPDNQVIILTPICAHSLGSRSIILNASDEILVKVEMSKKTQDEEVIATYDGYESKVLHAEDLIKIKKSDKTTKFVKFKSNNFFETLRTKIGNSEDYNL
ncbi:MAG: NAD(+)/NADH kinase [Clostridiales bacterium]|nr:NAD(+)/NADH kinase [Clostridiales bacterium]